MKQCRECGTLSSDDTIFCYVCGTKFNESEKIALGTMAGETLSAEQNSSNQSILGVNDDGIGNSRLLFNGVYQYKDEGYSSYLRFFSDGKVVGTSSTGNPVQVSRWLNHDFDNNGFYTVNDNIINFTLTCSNGRVSYSGRLLREAIDIDTTSHINGRSAHNKRYNFCCLT